MSLLKTSTFLDHTHMQRRLGLFKIMAFCHLYQNWNYVTKEEEQNGVSHLSYEYGLIVCSLYMKLKLKEIKRLSLTPVS